MPTSLLDQGLILRGPFEIAIDITNKCNYRCLQCYNARGENNTEGNELSDSEFLDLVDDICPMKPNNVCFCGGEPTLRLNLLCESAKRLRQSGIKSVSMVTNGSYIDDRVAHELYHYITKSGKAYTPELDDEDAVTEKQADRFAAELLLPADALKDAVMDVFHVSTMIDVSDSKALRFVARMQCSWWLPFQAIINRLFEENFISKKQYDALYEIDCRSEDGGYRRLLKSIDPEISDLLNKKTRTTGVSNQILETIISNYEDGFIDDDEFFHTLAMFDKKPEDFGFCMDAEMDEEMMDFFEREDTE